MTSLDHASEFNELKNRSEGRVCQAGKEWGDNNKRGLRAMGKEVVGREVDYRLVCKGNGVRVVEGVEIAQRRRKEMVDEMSRGVVAQSIRQAVCLC